MPDSQPPAPIPLSVSQQNIYRGVLQDADPTLYLIGRRYRLFPIPLPQFRVALEAAIQHNPVQLCVLEQAQAPYPHLVPLLRAVDLVQISGDDAELLVREWDSGILSRPWCATPCKSIRAATSWAWTCTPTTFCSTVVRPV